MKKNTSKAVVYVGLDVHAETISIAVAEGRARAQTVGTIPNRPESIRKAMKKLGSAATLRACYEAGPCGYPLYWQLTQMGIGCEVVAPTLVPVKAGDRIKTDKRDAAKLAECYRAGMLTAVYVPDGAHVGAARPGTSSGSGQKGSTAGAASAEQVSAAVGPTTARRKSLGPGPPTMAGPPTIRVCSPGGDVPRLP